MYPGAHMFMHSGLSLNLGVTRPPPLLVVVTRENQLPGWLREGMRQAAGTPATPSPPLFSLLQKALFADGDRRDGLSLRFAAGAPSQGF
jgi:hypothetical protein